MTGLARWCFTHRKRVIAGWFLALVVLIAANVSAGSGYTDNFSLPGTESTEALDLLGDHFQSQSNDQNQVVFGADSIKAEQAQIDTVLEAVRGVRHVDDVGDVQISQDDKVAFATVTMDGEQPVADVPVDAYENVIDTAQENATDALRVELGGSGIQQATQGQEGGGAGEMVGFLAAAIVLFLAFGSLFAMVLPLATAVLSLGCALMATGLLAHVLDIATFSPQLATLIGLGVGIDYALFVITRHRNAIKAGRTPEEACVRSLNTSGRAVLFAGATVVVALLGLLVLGVSFLNGSPSPRR